MLDMDSKKIFCMLKPFWTRYSVSIADSYQITVFRSISLSLLIINYIICSSLHDFKIVFSETLPKLKENLSYNSTALLDSVELVKDLAMDIKRKVL